MFDYLLYTPALMALGIYMYYYRIPSKVCDSVTTKYIEFKRLNKLVETQHKGRVKILIVSIQIVMKTYYLSTLQYLNNSVVKIGRNKYEVSYSINGRLYKMFVVQRKGPFPILQVNNHNNEDVTEYILPYLGPNHDWHLNRVRPDTFGHKSLVFRLSNGDEVIFEEHEHIELTT
jgi:hypothetical protein